jgi:hypothetical protein
MVPTHLRSYTSCQLRGRRSSSVLNYHSVFRHTGTRLLSASLKDTKSTTSNEDNINILANLIPIQYLRDIDPSRYDNITGQRIDVRCKG